MKIDAYVSDHRKKRQKRRAYLLIGGAATAAGLAVIGIVWFIFRSPFFELDHIVVEGNSVVPTDAVIELLQSSALRDHGFFGSLLGLGNILTWPDRVPQNDLVLLPQLASVVTTKDYFSNTLDAQVTERNPFAIWCFEANGKCYWFDNTGTIFGHAFNAEGNLIYTVNDASQKPKGLNQTVLPAEFLPNLISIMNLLHSSGLAVKSIELKNLALEEITVTTANGPAFYFSLRFPADNYLAVIQNLIKAPGFAKLQYIDCRTENRVYYK